MNELVESTKTHYDVTQAFHQDLLLLFEEIKKDYSNTAAWDLADIVTFLKKISEFSDDIRKEADRLIDTSSKLLCLRYVAQGDGGPVKGNYSSVSPTVRSKMVTPKKGSPEYANFVEELNTKHGLKFTLIDWPAINKHVTQLRKDGKPLPELFDFPEGNKCSVTCRIKK